MNAPAVLPHPDSLPLGEGTAEEHAVNRDPARCPLCGGANDCRLVTMAAYKGPCWCQRVTIPEELLARVPAADRDRACVCRQCVTAFAALRDAGGATGLAPEDYYLDERGRMVFTAAYLLRRGCCCEQGCRHCPFEREP